MHGCPAPLNTCHLGGSDTSSCFHKCVGILMKLFTMVYELGGNVCDSFRRDLVVYSTRTFCFVFRFAPLPQVFFRLNWYSCFKWRQFFFPDRLAPTSKNLYLEPFCFLGTQRSWGWERFTKNIFTFILSFQNLAVITGVALGFGSHNQSEVMSFVFKGIL